MFKTGPPRLIIHALDPHAARIFRQIRLWLKEDETMQRDRTRLVKVCCAPQPPSNSEAHHAPRVSRHKSGVQSLE
ncbi:MAG TPA: hypothetical protein VGO91_09160, partial [Pyrinomonadaceae bacterium]|nr:hypothetical protein [Pyrinomonadaceae bacterium]